jgi:isoamylase
LHNYWGYGPLAVFAPHGAYSSAGDDGAQTREFKEMVRCLHAADMELIVDISFAPAADRVGPTARQFIIEALRYWVSQMHVDGFRLDLTALLGRDAHGHPRHNPQLLEEIAEDPVLRDTKLIATGWDTAGAYDVESFSERRWAEWNTCYRDDIRRFWRGDPGTAGAFAKRISGSEDLFSRSGKGPGIGINFVTSHDGLTLNDLVTYQSKHNLPNGRGNCDGAVNDYSANYGVEGPTAEAGIESIRQRQVRNFLLSLLVSRGVPMLSGGDEFRRTQLGNNNAYCQDNPTSWYDWSLLQKNTGLQGFVRRLIELRRAHPVLSREEFYSPIDMCWFSPELSVPRWDDPRTRALACVIRDDDREELFFIFNAEDKPMSFRIPNVPAAQWRWHLAINTADELPVSGAGPVVPGDSVLKLAPRSAAVLVAGHGTKAAPAEVVKRCNPALEHCAKGMGGDDPDVAYAAALLWSHGYPEAFDAEKAAVMRTSEPEAKAST